MLAIFVAPKQEKEEDFRTFLEVSRNLISLQDVEFGYLFPEDFDQNLGNLASCLNSEFYKKYGF